MNAATASMLEIVEHVERALARGESSIGLDVLDPDAGAHLFAGELVDVPADGPLIHRPLRVWVDLAERLRLRLRTPRPLDPPLVRLTFEKLVVDTARTTEPTTEPSTSTSTRTSTEIEPATSRPLAQDATERYGASSAFARIRKLEDPTFVIDLTEALERVVASLVDADVTGAPRPLRVLDLGVNTGDELALILARVPALRDASFVGVDHSASAIATARERFAEQPNIQFIEADIAALGGPDERGGGLTSQLGHFDLVLSIGLLQSGALDDRELLRHIVQNLLVPSGAVILGMPNCRYVDGEVEYGARIVNITQPELGLLVKDLAFYRKYLQQHHRKVFVTGKHYVLVTAVAE